MPEGDRKLAAIMFTDIAGYTSLTQRNESLAMELLDQNRSFTRPYFAKHGGKEVKTMGDAFLVEFDSALEAVKCAYELQQALHELNLNRPVDKSVLLRIGVHLGDVIHSQNDVYGDAVNVASRIEPLASPGGVCISEQVYDQIKNKSDFPLSTLGKKELKNVGEAVEVFKVVFPWERDEPSGAGLDKKRIAVLPFANLSSDPEEGYFADGMTEELITSLSGVRQLIVIARTSVMGYKGTTKKVKEIAKELEVGSMLEGSVRKAGNRVRITAQLIDTATEGHLWAQNFDRQLEDVFAIQSEIAEKVAGELKVRLIEEEKRVIGKKATENTEAYMYYLRGRELIGERTERSLREALKVFETAIDLDPGFAKAHAGLAEVYTFMFHDGYEPYEQTAPKAELAVKKALQLDPELAEAHVTLANVDFQEDDVAGTERETRRALELNPSLAEAYYVLANIAFLRAEQEEGMKFMETAYRLDPVMPRYVDRVGMFYFYLGREAEALQHWEKTEQFVPAGTYRNMSEYYVSKGDFAKAKEFHAKAESIEPTHRWGTWMKGYIAAKTGDREGALNAIKEIEERWLGATSLNEVAFVYFALGDLDSYFTYITRAIDSHSVRFAYVMYCPLFVGAREDPRYQDLVKRLQKLAELPPR